jgi:hypothetical protein
MEFNYTKGILTLNMSMMFYLVLRDLGVAEGWAGAFMMLVYTLGCLLLVSPQLQYGVDRLRGEA